MSMNKLSIVTGAVILLGLIGCSNSNEFKSEDELYKDSVIPKSEHTMKEIYENRSSANNESQGEGMPTQYAGYMVNKRPIKESEAALSLTQ